ncbi:MAG: TusE/DsrC/DsvC family sulfur relay protein [Gammaproteobacteria bacterium]|nr:TusE/DsrC/DsvC family sulfur relay protein [Gammaproteobacteria bacterium]
MIMELDQQQKRELVLGIHDDDAVAMFKNWNKDVAKDTAKSMGIKLTDAHWGVIDFIRTYFANAGELRHARELSEALGQRFADEGGAKYLFQLFPGGPVSQGCQLAGVQVPKDASDNSFGYIV